MDRKNSSSRLGRLAATLLTAILFSLCGCAQFETGSYPIGQFRGKLTIEWIGADKFIYRPDPDRPLVFVRKNGAVIQPGLMYTDGGSIPKPLWAIRGYSPWGYGPAFIIHDWLFTAKHCGLADAKGQTVDTAAQIMGECMRTLIEGGAEVPKDSFYLLTMTAAVRTDIARKLWEDGKCVQPPLQLSSSALRLSSPEKRWVQTFDFDTTRRGQPR